MVAEWTMDADGHLVAVMDGAAFRIVAEAGGGRTAFEVQHGSAYGFNAVSSRFDGLEAAKSEAADFAAHLAQKAALGRRNAPGMEGGHSPWGRIQNAEAYGEGVTCVGTAGHGGFKLDGRRNREMPDALRSPGGWYEEDSEWARVALGLPALFTDRERRQAADTLRNWDPDAYEARFGAEIPPGASHAKDRKAFEAAHAGDLVAVSASMSRSSPGMVEVLATVGGHRDRGGAARTFLVEREEYRAARPFGFVVDPGRHAETGVTASPALGPR